MGYESKYFIVEKGSLNPDIDTKKSFCTLIAQFDLSKCYSLLDKISWYPATNSYFYDIDGEKEVLFDRYDDELTEIPLADMIYFVEEELQNKADILNRRLKPFYALLKAFENWENIIVLHFGY